ncbi:conserved membrane hypothetical protein [Hyella patelloides LEGE 07179]|uniref:DUF3611 family protein n=1 Tax=Hyella patelloides LEGE 07179 TaxID=945734 RepID=A0A563VJD5_9CYAN|nr:DUF3611 family protein [Hyella patelloides]VEP11511.1 conserved membrane hypothetical protein [Hyella patelloides LEGE 07179]
MTRDSDLASFSPLSPKVKQISTNLIIFGNAGFWLQLVLGIVSLMLLFFASPLLRSTSNQDGSKSLAIFCAALGVLTLAISIFFFFRRYISIGNNLKKGNSKDRPNKKYTIRLMKLGLASNLLGMFISLIGAEAFAGILYGKAAQIPAGAAVYNTNQLIEPVEIMALLANVHTIFSHFAGIVIGLWLIDRISK